MTVPEIIAALTPYTGRFPKEAVEAAIAQREEVTPHLLRILEEAAEAPEKFADPDMMSHVFASYLLAQFREKRAYRPLSRMLAAPGDATEELFGDTITEALNTILASVYDGDPGPLQQLVEGEEVYEFVRGAAVETFMILSHTGQMPRQEVVDYYRSLFHGKLRRESNQVWNALACAVADLPAPELIPELRQAYADDLVDPMFSGLDDLEREAQVPFEEKEKWRQEKQLSLIEDVVSEMSGWAAFAADDPPKPVGIGEEPIFPVAPFRSAELDEPWDPTPAPEPNAGLRRGPKTGRNEPCPCGSGKKYKKCCLGK